MQHSSEQARADELADVVGGVPAGELAGVYRTDAVFVSGSRDSRMRSPRASRTAPRSRRQRR